MFYFLLTVILLLTHMLMSIQHMLLDLQLVYVLILLQQYFLDVLEMGLLWYV